MLRNQFEIIETRLCDIIELLKELNNKIIREEDKGGSSKGSKNRNKKPV